MKNFPKVQSMQSAHGRDVANQFIINDGNAEFFQSYDSVIAMKKDGKIVLDADKWDYSVTTGKYRNDFLGEGIADTHKKIKSGEYTLADLN